MSLGVWSGVMSWSMVWSVMSWSMVWSVMSWSMYGLKCHVMEYGLKCHVMEYGLKCHVMEYGLKCHVMECGGMSNMECGLGWFIISTRMLVGWQISTEIRFKSEFFFMTWIAWIYRYNLEIQMWKQPLIHDCFTRHPSWDFSGKPVGFRCETCYIWLHVDCFRIGLRHIVDALVSQEEHISTGTSYVIRQTEQTSGGNDNSKLCTRGVTGEVWSSGW